MMITNMNILSDFEICQSVEPDDDNDDAGR